MAKKLIHVSAGNGGGGGGGDGPDTMFVKTDAKLAKGTVVTATLCGKLGKVGLWLSVDKEPNLRDAPTLEADQGDKAIEWTSTTAGPLYFAIECKRDSEDHLVGVEGTLSFE